MGPPERRIVVQTEMMSPEVYRTGLICEPLKFSGFVVLPLLCRLFVPQPSFS